MRIAFLVSLLLLSVFYTALAFADLNFLSARGRIAPGFFPQIIGTLLVLFTLVTTWQEFRRRRNEGPLSTDWKVTLAVVGMLGVLIVACHYLGALWGMLVFMLLALSVLNRGRHVTNLVVGIALPVGIFALFRYSLNAAMPPGTLGLPF